LETKAYTPTPTSTNREMVTEWSRHRKIRTTNVRCVAQGSSLP